MVTTVQPTTTSKTWAKAYIQPASEFGSIPLQVIAGNIPIGFAGVFVSLWASAIRARWTAIVAVVKLFGRTSGCRTGLQAGITQCIAFWV